MHTLRLECSRVISHRSSLWIWSVTTFWVKSSNVRSKKRKSVECSHSVQITSARKTWRRACKTVSSSAESASQRRLRTTSSRLEVLMSRWPISLSALSAFTSGKSEQDSLQICTHVERKQHGEASSITPCSVVFKQKCCMLRCEIICELWLWRLSKRHSEGNLHDASIVSRVRQSENQY